MTKKQRLEQRKAALVAEMRSISDKAEADEQRSLTEDETKLVDAHEAEIRSIDTDIARETRIEEFQRSLPTRESENTTAERESRTEQRSITIPATAIRTKRLKAFTGERAEERAFASGQWLRAVIGRNENAAQWCRDHGVETRALGEVADNLGGVLVPLEMERTIIDLREQYGIFRQKAKVENMASDTKIVPRRASGLTAYFVGENTEITASDKGWNQVQLTAKKVAVLTKYSSELAEDAIIGVADDLAMEIAYCLANKEDECGFNGDGTSTYGGMTGVKNALLAGSEYTAATGNTAFSTLDLEDFEGMIAKLPRYPGIQPEWYIHQAGWASSMLRLAAAAGGNTISDIQGGAQLRFLGYPVNLVNVMNSTLGAQTSTEGLVYFGDLAMGAMLGSRRGVSIALDSSRYFELDQLAIRGTERFDVVVHGIGTASVAGPIIQLLTPGS